MTWTRLYRDATLAVYIYQPIQGKYFCNFISFVSSERHLTAGISVVIEKRKKINRVFCRNNVGVLVLGYLSISNVTVVMKDGKFFVFCFTLRSSLYDFVSIFVCHQLVVRMCASIFLLTSSFPLFLTSIYILFFFSTNPFIQYTLESIHLKSGSGSPT